MCHLPKQANHAANRDHSIARQAHASRLVVIAVSLLCGICLNAEPAIGAPISIQIPRKNAGSGQYMHDVRATVTFAAGATVNLSITDPEGHTWTVPTLPTGAPSSCAGFNNATPGVSLACHKFEAPTTNICFNSSVDPAICGDQVIINSVSGAEPPSSRYEVVLYLYSNYDRSNSCQQTQVVEPAGDTYTFDTPSGPRIIGICLESFDLQGFCPTPNPGTIEPDQGAFVSGLPRPTQKCYKERPAVDVMMVLDKSGSMFTPLTSTEAAFCSGSSDRIGGLRCAANRFLNLWDPCLVQPSNPCAADPNAPAKAGDRVGVVSFSSLANTDTALTAITPGNAAVQTTINNIPIGGSTSIGAGLREADQNFTSSTGSNRKVVLLMTDGQQNTDPKVKTKDLATLTPGLYCDNPGSSCPLAPTCTSQNTCALTNSPQIYTVTLGPSTGVSQAVDRDIADASLGFYLHTDTAGNLLSPFFLELLQNFLKFNSYDTVRMISSKVPAEKDKYTADIPISTTSRDVVFSLMWPKDLGALQISATPPVSTTAPGGLPAIVRADASGFITLIQSLPLPPPFDPMGNWHVEVSRLDATTGATIPFDLHVMTDDGGVKSDLFVVPGDYKVGDNIRLSAKLRYFGLPILGLGSSQIFVNLIAPGQSVGDMLSESKASSDPPRADIDPGAEAKLFNAVANSPLPLMPPQQIALFDDGKPEHGDETAGDGIYNALYAANLAGDYNFVFSAESTDPNAIRFSRQQLRATYVRAIPDPDQTTVNTGVQYCSVFSWPKKTGGTTTTAVASTVGCNFATIGITPRTKFGNRLGPGWANYFWFKVPGKPATKATDNLNGTYTATIDLSGATLPDVSVYFENAVAVIGDSVTEDKLPVPLKDPPFAHPRIRGRFGLFFDTGYNVPQGTFGQVVGHGFSLNAGLEYVLRPYLSAEGIFGYHHFPKITIPGATTSDLNTYQFSFNAKLYVSRFGLAGRPARTFVNFGPGGYRLDGSTHPGGNVGGGILYELAPTFGLQGSYDIHVFNAGGAQKFSAYQGGIRFVF